MRPERVFQILLFLGLLAGGWLYGNYWKNTGRLLSLDSVEAKGAEANNTEFMLEIDALKDEVAQLRSMLGKGAYPIPDELIAWVETDYNMVFLEAPRARLAKPSAIREAALSNIRLVHGEEKLKAENKAWAFLGLIPPGQRLTGQFVTIASAGPKGIFDLTKGKILLTEDFDPLSVGDRSVLARLLALSLAYQNHPRKEWNSRDEWMAWEATFVGAAAGLQARFLRLSVRDKEERILDPEPNREAILMSLSPAIQGFSNFPFSEGNDYTRDIFRESRDAWAAMFRNPPTATQQIIHPDHQKEASPDLKFPSSPAPLLGKNNLGELGLRLWLEEWLDLETAASKAANWRGDQFELRGDDGEEFLMWRVNLSSAESAKNLSTEIDEIVLPRLRSYQSDRVIEVIADGPEMVFTNFPKS